MRDIRICFVGDSFVNGTGDPEKLGWAGRLCAAAQSETADVTCYNLGIRRNTSEDILKRWETECALRLPEGCDGRIVFSFGVNDAVIENGSRRIMTERTLQNARAMLTQASAHHKTLMIGPPPIDDDSMNEHIAGLDASLAELCREIGIPYLSVFGRLVHDPLWRGETASNDGAHPRAGGYSLLARLIGEWEGWWF